MQISRGDLCDTKLQKEIKIGNLKREVRYVFLGLVGEGLLLYVTTFIKKTIIDPKSVPFHRLLKA